MRKLSFIIFIVLSLSLQVCAQKDVQKADITKKMTSLKDALIAKDSVGLSSLLSDDVTYGHSNGLIQTKAQLIRSVMSGEQDYKSIEASGVNVRIYKNAGIVTSKTKVDLSYGGKPVSLSMYLTSIWIKLDNDWKLVARQSVKLPE